MAERRDRIRVHIAGQEFNVVGGKFQEMLAAVKQITGRHFVSELKAWQLPGTVEDIQNQLDISGYHLEGGIPLADSVSPTQMPSPRSSGDRIRVLIQEHQLAVVGGTFQRMLEAVKSLPGRRFDGDTKVWEIPGELPIIKNLIEAAGFQLEGAENVSVEAGSRPSVEPSHFAGPGGNDLVPPPFEEPDFFDDDGLPPFEPPDWLDEEHMPPPPPEPPGWWEEEVALPPSELPDYPDELPAFDHKPLPFEVEPSDPGPMTTGPAPRGDQIRIRLGGIPLVIAGGAFREMLAVVKNIPGRRFNGQEKVWEIPADVSLERVRQVVEAAGFVVKR